MVANSPISPPETDAVAVKTPTPRFETRMLLIIAGPLMAAYLAEFAMTLTTKAIVGKLGYLEFAAIGLASDMASDLIIIFVGLLSVVGVLVAQAEGAKNKADAGFAARQGLIVATALGVPAMAIVWHLDTILGWTGQDTDVIAVMGPFLKPLSLSVLPLMWFFVLRMFVASLAKTGAIMVITVLAVGLNFVLCLGLVEGRFGLPQMGVAGAGWAQSIVSVCMFLALLHYTYRTQTFRGYGLFKGRLRYDAALCKTILRLGLPVAGLVILESGLFVAVAILSGTLGPIPLATYQVIIAWVGIAFMMAHGLAESGMVRVAFGIGTGSMPAARQAGILTMAIGVGMLIIMSVIPLNFPEPIVRLFLDPNDPGFAPVLELTAHLLILAAFFQVFDGLQVIASMTLRGVRDTMMPLVIGAVGYWVFGVGGGWYLAFRLDMGAEGLWWGMAAGLTISGSLLALRFLWLTNPHN